MPAKARQLHDEWKRADDLAHEAEQQVAAEWDAFFDGKADPPSKEVLETVRSMRALANDRLTAFMEYMRRSTIHEPKGT